LEDRTLLNAQLLMDINTATGYSYPDMPVTINGSSYFGAADEIHGRELWRTDGTTAGTMLVKDINPGHKDGMNAESLVAMNNTLFLWGDDLINGTGLWRSDGTGDGFTFLHEFDNIFNFKTFNNSIFSKLATH
jgi:ELWxxDGT repeat protein